jgi:hypothetical protein
MKTITGKIVASAAAVVLCAVLLTCGNPMDGNGALGEPVGSGGGEAAFTISLGGAARAMYPPDDAMKARMDFTLTMTGGGATLTFTAHGTDSIKGRAKIASYQATVTAELDGVLYAKGSRTMDIKAGAENFFPFTLNDAQPVPPAPPPSYTWNTPGTVTDNGITATVSYSPASPQPAGTSITATVSFSGTATTSGSMYVNLTSDTHNYSGAPHTFSVMAGSTVFASRTFTFTMPAAHVSDMHLSFEYVCTLSVATLTTGQDGFGTVDITVGSENNTPGDSVTVTATPNSGYEFIKWVSSDSTSGTLVSTSAVHTFTINADTSLYAVFGTPNDADFGFGVSPTPITFTSASAANALETYLTGTVFMSSGDNFAITVEGDQHVITGGAVNSLGINKVSLRGSGTIKKAGSGAGALLQVNNGARLVLRGVKLDGNNQNGEVVSVASSGELVMESGVITGANNIGFGSGGVDVLGSFIMKGGSITGNQTTGNGGGVFVNNPNIGVFTMTGGTITNNTAGSDGGGVYIASSGCTFNLNSPATTSDISGNTPNEVYKSGGNFNVDGISQSSGY